jgi:hypothetical protein
MNMKMLLSTAAALVALAATADAASPTIRDKRLLGSFCYSYGDKNEAIYLGRNPLEQKPPGCEDDNFMTVYPTYYDGWEHTCRFTAVKTWFDRNVIATTKTMGVNVTRVDANCSGEGCTWKEQFTLYIAQGTLTVRDHRHDRERC